MMNWKTEIKRLCADLLIPYTVEAAALKKGNAAPKGHEYDRAYGVVKDYIMSNRF